MSHSVDDSLTRGDISAGLGLEIVEDFWRKVCERAERDGCFNSIPNMRVVDYGAAARAILAEMRRASE